MNIVPNTYPLNLTNGLTGSFNSISAIGGFNINKTLPTILLASTTPIKQFDLTSTVQIVIDVNVFNNKLFAGGYNSSTNDFSNNSITINSTDFINDLSSISQIVSVGSLSSVYSDFSNFVNNYFNYGSGLPSILSSGTYSYGNNVFDASALINIIDSSNTSGSITINNVNQILKYALDFNTFGNRPKTNGMFFNNGSISHGFQDGDLILIGPGPLASTSSQMLSTTSTGIVLTLNLSLNSSSIVLPDPNSSYPYSTTNSIVQAITGDVSTYTNTYYNANINSIQITRFAPLLFILKKLS
jgi:hypothetical protein